MNAATATTASTNPVPCGACGIGAWLSGHAVTMSESRERMMTDDLLEAMARAHDRESAAQRGEPSPWSRGEPPEAWRAQRIASMRAALEALRQAGYVVVRQQVDECDKARLIGEFSFAVPEADENGNEWARWVEVPWSTLRDIRRAIIAAAQEDT